MLYLYFIYFNHIENSLPIYLLLVYYYTFLLAIIIINFNALYLHEYKGQLNLIIKIIYIILLFFNIKY